VARFISASVCETRFSDRAGFFNWKIERKGAFVKMTGEVLVLNSDYEPLNVCNLRRAVVLVFLGKADILHVDERETCLHVADGEVQAPSVVRLRYHVRRPLPELKLSRRSIFARDNYTCQYCGMQTRDLTIDHIVPKRHGGPMHWENLVACCRRCNTKKGDKMLNQSGMRLARAPRRPRYVPYISLTKYVNGTKNEVWRNYLPTFNDVGGHHVQAPGELLAV
jgi:5-methylcytosine-specific restriction endonuclease McrA